MSDLFGNHIVGFPTRRLICLHQIYPDQVIIIWISLMQIKVSSVNARIQIKKYKMSKVLYVLQCLVHISSYFQCLLLPPIKTWPYTYGWTFSCWLRLDPVTGVTVERERPYLYWYVYTILSPSPPIKMWPST